MNDILPPTDPKQLPPNPPETDVATGEDQDAFEELYGYSDEILEQLRHALAHDAPHASIMALLDDLHAADIADLLQRLSQDERDQFIHKLGNDLDSEILSHLDYGVRLGLVSALPLAKLAGFLATLESDDAVDIIEDLNEEEQAELLRLVPAPDRAVYEQALSYPDESAGRLMRREVVTVPNFWTVGQTIDFLRVDNPNLPDDFYSLVVVGPNHKPLGLLPLSKLLRAPRVAAIATLMERDPKLIPAEMDQEDAAFLFQQYGLVEAPVVDEDGRLVGAITIDDIVDVIHEENEEDMLSLAGVGEDDFYANFIATSKARFGWLFLNLITAIVASLVIGVFETQIQALVALAVLMPIVASMGGNAGTQTLAVAVRAIATNELTTTNALTTIGKETLSGMLNGLIFALIMGLVAWGWFSDMGLGLVIALAMLINLTVAGLAGVLIPLALEKMGKDPAISSGVFLTTITDVVGFLSFLGFATLLLLRG